MYVLNKEELNKLQSIKTSEEVSDFDKNECFIDYFIRQEELEFSLITRFAVLIKMDYITQIEKTNKSRIINLNTMMRIVSK